MDSEEHGQELDSGSALPETQSAHNQSVLSDVHAVLRDMQEQGRGEIDTPRHVVEPAGEQDAPKPVETAEPELAEADPFRQSVDRWAPVMDRLGIDRSRAIDNYMAAVVSLHNDPVATITQLAQTYLRPEQAQQALAALANQYGIDPYDVDIDSYKQQLPQQQHNREIAQLRAQMLQMQIESLRSSGKYPLLSDEAAAQAIAANMGKYADMSIEQAYALAVHSDPDLSAKHARAVAGEGATNKEAAEAERRSKLRRAKAADLPRGAAGERTPTPTGNKVFDDVKAIALELGFGSN